MKIALYFIETPNPKLLTGSENYRKTVLFKQEKKTNILY